MCHLSTPYTGGCGERQLATDPQWHTVVSVPRRMQGPLMGPFLMVVSAEHNPEEGGNPTHWTKIRGKKKNKGSQFPKPSVLWLGGKSTVCIASAWPSVLLLRDLRIKGKQCDRDSPATAVP